MSDPKNVPLTANDNILPAGVPLPEFRYDHERRCVTRCQADFDDGVCTWKHCPQLRDNEPTKTGRHCQLDDGKNFRRMDDE